MGNRIQLLHQSPGRIRLAVAGLKGNAGLSRSIQALEGRVRGVRSISASTVTASVLIRYDASDPHVLPYLKGMLDDAELWLSLFGGNIAPGAPGRTSRSRR